MLHRVPDRTEKHTVLRCRSSRTPLYSSLLRSARNGLLLAISVERKFRESLVAALTLILMRVPSSSKLSGHCTMLIHQSACRPQRSLETGRGPHLRLAMAVLARKVNFKPDSGNVASKLRLQRCLSMPRAAELFILGLGP